MRSKQWSEKYSNTRYHYFGIINNKANIEYFAALLYKGNGKSLKQTLSQKQIHHGLTKLVQIFQIGDPLQ